MRNKVGCVVIDAEGRVVATGYNGPAALWRAPGMTAPMNEAVHCDGFCPRALGDPTEATGSYTSCVAAHAEMNALMTSDRRHREGGTIYVTRAPCSNCAKAVANSGVVRGVFGPVPDGYPEAIYEDMLAGQRLLIQSQLEITLYTA